MEKAAGRYLGGDFVADFSEEERMRERIFWQRGEGAFGGGCWGGDIFSRRFFLEGQVWTRRGEVRF